ncbi:MAG: HlyD family efflux transporter periplasmic adaptor subunit [Phycisphaerales bacterium]|nr:MAG: HlyD family efflux transporter periplasmic adaptor subunit [Phycisphaerales bacterium]
MKRKPSRAHFSRRAYLHHVMPVVVWLATVAVVIGLFYSRTQRFEVLGLAQGRVYEIAASCTGRIKSIPVELFEHVEQGQVVAVLDTTLDNEHIQAELSVVAAQIEHLAAQLVPTQEQLQAEATNLETDRVRNGRGFSADVENARLRILELRALIASDRITLEDLGVEVKISQDLRDAIAPYELERLQAQYNALSEKMAENGHLLEQARANLDQARERRDEFVDRQLQHPSIDGALEVIRKQIAVQERLIDQLVARSDPLELRAPAAGVVVSVVDRADRALSARADERALRRPGEVVRPGDQILVVADAKPTEIVAYVAEEQVGQVREKMVVELVKPTDPAQIARSEVVSIGPAVEQLPPRLWLNPNLPQWGRPFRIRIPPQMKLVVGERVGVRRL